MSEKNNIFENDLLMRAILEGGQEEVPGHVWDAVSERLDKAARNRRMMWWRRAGIGVAAAAAAVVSVLVLNRPEQTDIVDAVRGDMIAVVEQEPAAVGNETVAMEDEAEIREAETVVRSVPGHRNLVAYVPEAQIPDRSETSGGETMARAETEPEPVSSEIREEGGAPVQDVTVSENVEEKTYFPVVWEDDDSGRNDIRTAITVSGITGATGSQHGDHSGIFKAPALTLAPAETGITERNSTSGYGLPLSFGAGVKIDFTPRWSLGVGLNYTFLTRTFNGTYTHVAETGAIDNLVTSDIRNSQHYIGIPLNIYFNILDSRHVNFYAYAGGTLEKCVYDKYKILSASIVHKEPADGVQLSADLGLGVEFMLWEHLGLYIDPSLRYYFDCGQPKSIRTAQPLMLGFELGFRFRL